LHEERLVLRWGEARLTIASIETALLFAALALPALWAGWALFGALGIGRIMPRPRLAVAPKVLSIAGTLVVLLSTLLMLLFLSGRLVPGSSQVMSVLGLFMQTDLGFAMLYCAMIYGNDPRRDKLLYFGLALLTAAIGMIAGVLLG